MRVLVVGLGLIGGSIGIALRRAGWVVSYVDPNVPFDDAKAMGAADEMGNRECDLTVLATPVNVAVWELESRSGRITSVCSVMQPLRAVGSSNFVAGHPLAGSAEHGIHAASGDLFRGKKWFVDAQDDVVDRMIKDCGAQPELVSAIQHDCALALTSHLPQVLSTALAAYLAERDVADFAGTGLASFLRLAGSDASVWRPILDANRDEIEQHIEPLMRIVRQILEGDDAAFDAAQEFQKRL